MDVTLPHYVRRKRFRSPKNARRAELAAARKRRERLFESAVAAGHPLALEADFFRSPMKRYHAEQAALTPAERKKLYEECSRLVGSPEAKAKYLELRQQVISETESMFS